jgi:hypothetical protein
MPQDPRELLAQMMAARQQGQQGPDPTAGQGYLDYLMRFLNPFSTPPGSAQQGPSLRDVVVPPASASPPVQPPSLGAFLNPFSPPPGSRGRY